MTSPKAVVDLSAKDMAEFFSLHNAYKSADKQDERARTSWKFLRFVNKHLSIDLLNFFVDNMFEGDDMKKTIVRMIQFSEFMQPNL